MKKVVFKRFLNPIERKTDINHKRLQMKSFSRRDEKREIVKLICILIVILLLILLEKKSLKICNKRNVNIFKTIRKMKRDFSSFISNF
jgi:hypothetical protein